MEQHDLRRVLDQVKPSRDQEEAMLRRLLAESKKEEQRSMKWSKKVTAVLLAAAVMLMACAFTAAMGLDQRLLSLFGAGEQEARLIEAGVVQVDQSHTYENGWTVGVEQVLVDRYTLAVLMEVTAPEGTALRGSGYGLVIDSDIQPRLEADGSDSWVSGSTVLPDDNPEDQHISILWHQGPTAYLQWDAQTFLGGELTIAPVSLEKNRNGELADFSQEQHAFHVKLPDQDSGRQFQIGLPIQVGEDIMTLQSLYFSPISIAFTIQGEGNDSRMWGPVAFSEIESTTHLNLPDSQSASVGQSVSQNYNPVTGLGEFVFQLNQIADPEKVVSITILGQTFSLEGMIPEQE